MLATTKEKQAEVETRQRRTPRRRRRRREAHKRETQSSGEEKCQKSKAESCLAVQKIAREMKRKEIDAGHERREKMESSHSLCTSLSIPFIHSFTGQMDERVSHG
jgi:hypothetical protein